MPEKSTLFLSRLYHETSSHETRTCPTCADDLSVDTLSDVPRIVTDYLDELSIRCDFYERGCRELVQLQKLKQHVAECGLLRSLVKIKAVARF